jgi:hypothetical protein
MSRAHGAGSHEKQMKNRMIMNISKGISQYFVFGFLYIVHEILEKTFFEVEN